jgi:hypothetical protein
MVQKRVNPAVKSTLGFVGFLATMMVSAWARAVPYDEFGERKAAVYSVPVSEVLEPYASYPNDQGIGFIIDGQKAILVYHLPKELTGLTTSEIILKGEVGAGDSFELRGTCGAVGVCKKLATDQKISCRIKYERLAFDLPARRKILRARYTNPLELAGRTQVARLFSKEPVGILTFDE